MFEEQKLGWIHPRKVMAKKLGIHFLGTLILTNYKIYVLLLIFEQNCGTQLAFCTNSKDKNEG